MSFIGATNVGVTSRMKTEKALDLFGGRSSLPFGPMRFSRKYTKGEKLH
jgi:hypothetical protein